MLLIVGQWVSHPAVIAVDIGGTPNSSVDQQISTGDIAVEPYRRPVPVAHPSVIHGCGARGVSIRPSSSARRQRVSSS